MLYKVPWFTNNTALIAQESSSPADVRAAAARAEGQEVTDMLSVRIQRKNMQKHKLEMT